MFIIKLVGAVKGIESGEEMAFGIQQAVERTLKEEFNDFAVWEIFVTEEKTLNAN